MRICKYFCTFAPEKMISYLRKYSKWALIYILWMCGIIVVYASFISDLDDRQGMIIYNTLFTILLAILFPIMRGRMRKVSLVIFSLIAVVPFIIETGWFLIDRSPLIRTQFWVIFDTNLREAGGLLSMIQLWQWLWMCFLLGISIIFFRCALNESNKTKDNYVSLLAGILASVVIFIPGIRHNVPYINFYNSYRGYYEDVKRAEEFMLSRQDLDGMVMDEFLEPTATIVVIIGESLNKNHCSLYGYCRPTTPRLDKRDDIIVYQNVVSPDYMTQVVLQQVLTFASSKNPEARWNTPTLPELLNTAGWHTYWFDPYEGEHNTANSIATGFASIAKLCTNYHLGEKNEQYDEANLDHLDKILQDSTSKRKVIFLHLIGNHFPYIQRYPVTFNYFSNEDICSPFVEQLSSNQKEVINAYDNAVRYNDWFVDSVLNRLCLLKESATMIYFSDHGEEVYDYDFYAGRSFNHITPSLYEIPCIFWQNEQYSKNHSLYINNESPYCTDDMIHTLLDLCAVSYEQKDTCRSLFRRRNQTK